MVDPEIVALQKCTELFESLDESGRNRVLDFLGNRFRTGAAPGRGASDRSAQAISAIPDQGSEIPGIALRGPDGNIKITARDLKAKSANDAAIRLVHIVLFAHSQFTGEKWAHSKTTIVPLLKSWRVYDGNTRHALAAEKGIRRNGRKISLDEHAERQAREYIDEILDEAIRGSWTPNGKKRTAVKRSLPR